MNSSVRTYKVNRIDSQKRLINAVFLVGVARLELAASTSQMSRPTIWATPRNYSFVVIIVVKQVYL